MKNILGKKADYISPEMIYVSVLNEDILIVSGDVGLEDFDNVKDSIEFGI